jgi:hypothetical protein
VELDLNHILTEETRRKFKVDLAKRRKRRQAKVQAEKRADRAAMKEETERINERKARLQLIDPDDEFFHVPTSLPPDPHPAYGAEFGPALGASSGSNEGDESSSNPTATQPTIAPAAQAGISFSAALRRGHDSITISSTEAFPALGSADSFPALGNSAMPRPTVEKKPSVASQNPTAVVGGKQKKKGQKLVLFSTGGARGFT